MDTLQIEERIKKIILKYLPKGYQTFLFGSRVLGTAKTWSDFDVGIRGKKPLPLRTITLINEELEESSIPVKVDVVDFSRVSPKFQQVSLEKIKLWKRN